MQVHRVVPVPSLQARAPSGCDASCRGQEGGLGQRQKEGKKRRLLLPEPLEPSPRSCISRALDGTLKLYKEPGARSVDVTSQPSPAPPAGEAPGETGRGEESWRPPGHFLRPPVWGRPPLSPWATRAPRDPQSRCCQSQELPVWSSPWALRLCFLKGAEAIKRADSDPQTPPDQPGVRVFVPGSDGRFCICPPGAGSTLCWRMIPPREASACLGNLASLPVREDAFHLEGVRRALCPGGGCPAVRRGSLGHDQPPGCL